MFCEISDVQSPRVLARLQMNASPAKAVFDKGRILIPAGRAGLLSIQLANEVK